MRHLTTDRDATFRGVEVPITPPIGPYSRKIDFQPVWATL